MAVTSSEGALSASGAAEEQAGAMPRAREVVKNDVKACSEDREQQVSGLGRAGSMIAAVEPRVYGLPYFAGAASASARITRAQWFCAM